jgi:hypothetical protein
MAVSLFLIFLSHRDVIFPQNQPLPAGTLFAKTNTRAA